MGKDGPRKTLFNRKVKTTRDDSSKVSKKKYDKGYKRIFGKK